MYRGRFAPSPTGDLHLGSLVTALASYLEAKSNNGLWLLRIDDLDQTRVIKNKDKEIINTLESFGFIWDESIEYQSQNISHYEDALSDLIQLNKAYICNCSRTQIAEIAQQGREGLIYPETCKNKNGITGAHSIRLITENKEIGFKDGYFSDQQQNIKNEIGDFIIKRRDGFTAYQLAVVVDDHLQEINHVVRGQDLLSSSPRQIYVQRLLGYKTPNYTHIPLVMDDNEKKLSKQLKASPVSIKKPIQSLQQAWIFLFGTPYHLIPNTLEGFWPWAIQHWDLQQCKTKHRTN